MAADFLSSDIVFPGDSHESKLSSALSKMPAPVDWALHDYYSTAIEKVFSPVHALTDLRKLEPVDESPLCDEPMFSTDYWKPPPMVTVQKDKSIVVFLPRADVHDSKSKPGFPLPYTNDFLPQAPNPKQELRAALCGALEMVENDIQRSNHHKAAFNASVVPSYEWTNWKDQVCTVKPTEERWDKPTKLVTPPPPRVNQEARAHNTSPTHDKPARKPKSPWSYKRLLHNVIDRLKRSSTHTKTSSEKQAPCRRPFWKRA